PLPALRRADRRDHQRDGAEVVAARGLRLLAGAEGGCELRQRPGPVDVGHRRQRYRAGPSATWGQGDAILKHVVLSPASPEKLAALELHAPLPRPRRLRSGADPAAPIADHQVALEL